LRFFTIAFIMTRKPQKFNSKSPRKELVANLHYLRRNGYSIREIARIMKLKKSNVHRWLGQDMSPEAQMLRRKNTSSSRRILTGKEEKIIAGWIIIRCILKKSCTTWDLRTFLSIAFSVDVQPSWISNFLARNHLSLQDASIAKGSEMNELKFRECVEFLERFRKLGKRPEQIAIIDKTKFYYDYHRVKHIGMKGAGRRRVYRQNIGTADCVYTMLVGNGTIGKVYIESQVAKKVENVRVNSDKAHVTFTHKDQVRRGEVGYLKFLKWAVKEKLLVPGDVLISDNESSFKTEKVEEYLERNDITPLNFPSYMGHLMNPCDNYFHASAKFRYWQLISKIYDLDYQSKIDAIVSSYYGERKESILAYLENCGLRGERDPVQVVRHLLKEGLFPRDKFESIHNEQLQTYIEWRSNSKFNELLPFLAKYYPMEFTPVTTVYK